MKVSLSGVWLFVTVSLQAPLSLGISKQEYQSEFPFPSPGDLPNPGIEPWFPALQADYLPAEPAEKPKNTGMGSLSLLQRIFSTQELKWGLLHCRKILYQLSYQGSPILTLTRSFSKLWEMEGRDGLKAKPGCREQICKKISKRRQLAAYCQRAPKMNHRDQTVFHLNLSTRTSLLGSQETSYGHSSLRCQTSH